MAYHDKRLVLASASPRRRELLDRFGLAYEVIPAVGEEAAPRGLPPGELVALLAAHGSETVIRNDLRSLEILKFCRICTALFRDMDQHLCAFQISIVIGGDIRDKISRMIITDN